MCPQWDILFRKAANLLCLFEQLQQSQIQQTCGPTGRKGRKSEGPIWKDLDPQQVLPCAALRRPPQVKDITNWLTNDD